MKVLQTSLYSLTGLELARNDLGMIWESMSESEAYSETCQISTTERFAKTVNGYKPLTALREKCPNMEFFLVRIFPHSD